MRLAVDANACQGHARCVLLLPQLLTSDELGFAVVTADGDVPSDLEARARQAVANCPERAVRLVEGVSDR